MTKEIVTWMLAVFLCAVAQGQAVLALDNPSFEAGPLGPGKTPPGWIDQGVIAESPTDVQPGSFGVVLPAADGKQYVSMVVRDDHTWEGIAQVLPGWMRRNQTYEFSVWVARSNAFTSMSRKTGQPVDYKASTVLKIWGINSRTAREELLGETSPIGHSKWVKYAFKLFSDVSDYDQIALMAYYAPGEEDTNGNLLIDNCSDIVAVDWDSNDIAATHWDDSLNIKVPDASFETGAAISASQNGWRRAKSCFTCEVYYEPGHHITKRNAAYKGDLFVVLRGDKRGNVNTISQLLPAPMRKGQDYFFSAYLSHLSEYRADPMPDGEKSLSRVNYGGRMMLEVWGYDEAASKYELLDTSPLIGHEDWRAYSFYLVPTANCTSIVLRVAHDPKAPNPYNGHICIDNCSNIEVAN
jgi:hypothetical protein